MGQLFIHAEKITVTVTFDPRGNVEHVDMFLVWEVVKIMSADKPGNECVTKINTVARL